MSRKDEKRERDIKELEGIAALLTKTLKKKRKSYTYTGATRLQCYSLLLCPKF